jgi:tRNA threonylcarbamoyladenosine biosynthesis protein TsaE
VQAGYGSTVVELKAASPGETRELGRRLGAAAAAGDCVGLVGDLGAGKTCFVQGVAAGLGVPAEARVTSPTFTLVNIYRGGRIDLVHSDLYRIERAAELVELGLDDVIGEALVCVEWSDRFDVLPADSLVIELSIDDPGRLLRATAGGPDSEALLERWLAR